MSDLVFPKQQEDERKRKLDIIRKIDNKVVSNMLLSRFMERESMSKASEQSSLKQT